MRMDWFRLKRLMEHDDSKVMLVALVNVVVSLIPTPPDVRVEAHIAIAAVAVFLMKLLVVNRARKIKWVKVEDPFRPGKFLTVMEKPKFDVDKYWELNERVNARIEEDLLYESKRAYKAPPL